MAQYFVSRHPGALEWAERRGLDAKTIPHLDAPTIRTLQPGDSVFGTLPVHLAAQVCARGARYHHLALPQAERGAELDADAMERAGAYLTPLTVRSETPPADQPQRNLASLRIFILGFALFIGVSYSLDLALDHLKVVFAETSIAPERFFSAFAALCFLVVSFGIAYLMWERRNALFDLTIRRSTHVAPRRGLIVGLSYLWPETIDEAEVALAETPLQTLLLSGSEFSHQAEIDPGLVVLRNPWQQLMRAIGPHLPRLEYVIVIASSDAEKATVPQFPNFQRAATKCLATAGYTVKISICEGAAPNFENFDDIRDAYQRAVAMAEREDIPRNDLCMDVTGGTKVFSVATAALTLNDAVVFTYVNNEGHAALFDGVATLGDM